MCVYQITVFTAVKIWTIKIYHGKIWAVKIACLSQIIYQLNASEEFIHIKNYPFTLSELIHQSVAQSVGFLSVRSSWGDICNVCSFWTGPLFSRKLISFFALIFLWVFSYPYLIRLTWENYTAIKCLLNVMSFATILKSIF